MVKVQVGGKELYLDGYLRSNMDFIKKDVRNDSDAVIIVSGKERGGKSVFAMQLGFYLDPTLTLDQVCFTPQEFRKAVLAARKHQVILYDEAITGLRAQRWSTEVNQALIELLAQIGQKNLVIIIVIPSYFELGKYIAIHRSVALLHVYRKDGRRGYFRAYNEESKTRLYVMGKKTYDYRVSKPNFWGRFTNNYVLDETEYRKKKFQALSAVTGQLSSVALKFLKQRDTLIKHVYDNEELNQSEIAEIISKGSGTVVGRSRISKILAQFRGNEGTGSFL